MKVNVRFTPLYGAREGTAVCGLLEIDDIRILLDCGWDDRFEVRTIERLREVAEQVDLVLISHADLDHVGALPYARANFGLRAPVFMTAPCRRLAQVVLYEALLAHDAESKFDAFSLEDVDEAFALASEAEEGRVRALRFREEVVVAGVTLVPDSAGSTLGGAVWRIVRLSEVIVYAVGISTRNELMLDRSVVVGAGGRDATESVFHRPTLLISDPGRPPLRGARPPSLPSRSEQQRDPTVQKLLDLATEKQGDVLVPVDTPGRALELLLRCDSQWDPSVQLVWLHPLGNLAVQVAQMHLESMSMALNRAFSETRKNPFELAHAHIVSHPDELQSLRVTPVASVVQRGPFVFHDAPKFQRRPLVVLTPLPSLETGPARQVLPKWAAEENNAVVFVAVPRAGSLAATMLAHPPPPALTMRIRAKQPLEGEAWLEWRRQAALQRAAEARAGEFRAVRGVGEEGGEGDGMEEVERGGEGEDKRMEEARKGGKGAEAAEQAKGAGSERGSRGGGGIIAAARHRLRTRAAMFSFEERRVQPSEFGDPVDPDWLRDPDEVPEPEVAASPEGGAGTPANAADVGGGGPLALARRLLRAQRRAAGLPEEDDAPVQESSSEEHIPLRCRVLYLDMDGRADPRSLTNTIEALEPVRAALVYGAESRLRWLVKALQAARTKLLVPTNGERVEGSSGTSLVEMRLANALFQQLDFRKIGRYEVARVAGVVAAAGEEGGLGGLPVLEGLAEEDEKVEDGMEESVMLRKAPMKLRWIRTKLTKVGIPMDIQEGSLVSPAGLVIRPATVEEEGAGEGTHGLVIEGPLSEEYFLARATLCALTTVV